MWFAMEQFINFVIANWWLWLALIIVLALLVHTELGDKVNGMRRVSPQETVNLINREKAAVVDIRDTDVYNKGHIVGAISLPAAELPNKLKRIEKYKQKPMILCCASGQQSPKLGALLAKEGFTQVYFIQGGMAEWQTVAMPTVKGKGA